VSATAVYPTGRAARDRFVLARRGPRLPADPWAAPRVVVDPEPDGHGGVIDVATLFLTGRECPWRCVMCDLWRHTIEGDTPPGAIPHQIRLITQPGPEPGPEPGAEPVAQPGPEPGPQPRAEPAEVRWIRYLKLYNAGSFFDPRAVPPADDPAIARAVARMARVTVESHPHLIGDRTWRFRDLLARAQAGGQGDGQGGPSLEVAMGLETAHPAALEQLQKHLTVEGFASAAAKLAAHGVRLRVFLLVQPPFIAPDEQDDWLARSVDAALACGASTVSLIPTRLGNGPLDVLEADGAFRAPVLADLERSLAIALRVAGQHVATSRPHGAPDRTPAGDRAVLADLWDVDRLAACRSCVGARRARLDAMNLAQRVEPAVACADCGGSVA
jgi:hypothetical protein